MGAIVIIGAGHAGVQVAGLLRSNGYKKRILLITAESDVPYNRPILSKNYAFNGIPEVPMLLRPEEFFKKNSIDLLLGRKVIEINSGEKQIKLDDQSIEGYENLILATGSIPRSLPISGSDKTLSLYTLEDTGIIYNRLKLANNLVVIGGGFIGLELAVGAAKVGKNATVLEAAPRILGRSVAQEVSELVNKIHLKNDVKIHKNVKIDSITKDGVITKEGTIFPADLVIVGIGSNPNTELAVKSGLKTENGIIVDAKLKTSADNIFAIGDVASFPNPRGSGFRRFESVQNANDQAKCLAANLTGKNENYNSLPWFWSDQGDVKLQMVGDSSTADETVSIQGDSEEQLSIFHFEEKKLVALDTVNHPENHIFCRKLLSFGNEVLKDDLQIIAFDLKAAVKKAKEGVK